MITKGVESLTVEQKIGFKFCCDIANELRSAEANFNVNGEGGDALAYQNIEQAKDLLKTLKDYFLYS